MGSIPPLFTIPASTGAPSSIYNDSSLRQSLPGRVPRLDLNRRKSMKQRNLFPPSGAVTQPLPNEIQVQVRQLLAQLLVAVPEAVEQLDRREGEDDEQDPH
jgi:hypothetical protein